MNIFESFHVNRSHLYVVVIHAAGFFFVAWLISHLLINSKTIKMKKISLYLFFIAAFFMVSCKKEFIKGSGPIVSRTLTIGAFSKAGVHYDIDVDISYGNIPQVKVTGYENLLNILDIRTDNGVLIIKYNRQYTQIRNGNVRVQIMLPIIESASVYGSGDVKVMGFLTGNQFSAGIYGSGSVTVENAVFQYAAFDIYGSGKIEAQGLQVKDALVQVYGSGHSYISVSEKLVSKIFGSGNIYYRGNPVLETTQNGSGRVIKL